jgi:hypothetical protein
MGLSNKTTLQAVEIRFVGAGIDSRAPQASSGTKKRSLHSWYIKSTSKRSSPEAMRPLWSYARGCRIHGNSSSTCHGLFIFTDNGFHLA